MFHYRLAITVAFIFVGAAATDDTAALLQYDPIEDHWTRSGSSAPVLAGDRAVRRIVNYTLAGQKVRWVEWANYCVKPTNMNTSIKSVEPFICPGSNAIDIGAHVGDTAVAIAAATRGGTTYAYEPHPKTFHILQMQSEMNPQLNLQTFNTAIMNGTQEKLWWHGVHDGCNGGISNQPCSVFEGLDQLGNCAAVKSEDAQAHFGRIPTKFTRQLSFIKIDTEGNDRFILRGLKETLLTIVRPVILMEWYIMFQGCDDEEGMDMFRAIEEIGYVPYEFTYEGKDAGQGQMPDHSRIKKADCRKYVRDLLLFPREWDVHEQGYKICPQRSPKKFSRTQRTERNSQIKS